MSYQDPGQYQPPPVVDQGPPLDPRYVERKKEARKAKKRGFGEQQLAITSLMDALTIVLCFLLASYASDPVVIQQSDKLRIAYSATKHRLQAAAKIQIDADAIYCNDKQTALLHEENGIRTVDEKAKTGGKTSFMIEDLKAQLEEYRRTMDEIEKRGGRKLATKTWVMVVADILTPIRIIKEVLFTAKEAGYERYMFAVIQKVGWAEKGE